MPELGGLVFSSPWLLAALATLPALWWLLRVTPPSPRVVSFPPVRLLLALRPREETPARTPWWLIVLRMLAAALVIVGLAHPLLNPGVKFHGTGPLVLVVDDGWASAPDWTERRNRIDELLVRAERENRPVHFLTTAPARASEPLEVSRLMRAADARSLLAGLVPKPWPPDRAAALTALRELSVEGSAHAVWIADGIGDPAAAALAKRLQSLGSLTVIEQPAAVRAWLVGAPESGDDGFSVPVSRVAAPAIRDIRLQALAEDGRLVAEGRAGRFESGAAQATVRIDLPAELRNEVARVTLAAADSAGGVFLVDERWRRRPVGVVPGDAVEAEQPLLSATYYLERALAPFAEVRRGSVAELLERGLAVIALPDAGRLLAGDAAALAGWIGGGGVLLRFAGPKLAAAAGAAGAEDAMLPVRLRGGDRSLGGTMSWTEPARLLPFEDASPFAGLAPPADVRVRRQVLAEPELGLDHRTWARLSDGTPLVTAERRGRGWLVLIHTTANTDWSNLPISGLFVDMLRRIVALSVGVTGARADAVLPPFRTLDGFGRLGPPPAGAVSVPSRELPGLAPSAATPPGYYGTETARHAFNLAAGIDGLAAIGGLPAGVERQALVRGSVLDFRPWLLLAALLLVLADFAASLALRGLLRFPRPGRAVAAGLAGLALFAADPGAGTAQTLPGGAADAADRRALEATSVTRLAYVRTGDRALDKMTEAGMHGLAGVLKTRTSVEPGATIAVDIETDDLALFPLLYWAVSPRQQLPSERARRQLARFLRTGGTILFDTRARGGSGAAALHLRRLLDGLDVPSLTRLPDDHVLSRSFYLLDDFPGRWAGGPVWVERRGGRHNDGVSPVVIGSNDWAAAWAVDRSGRPLAAVVPDGERQREMAYRFGVNWVMYALTGNYKADQVHVNAIIERLGQ